jgi:putative salt-induced outer membrane protein YdiY
MWMKPVTKGRTMILKKTLGAALAGLGMTLAGLGTPVAAQDERELGWFDQAELTFVMTGGNTSQSTFGLKNSLDRVWENAAFRLTAGGLRTESTAFTRTATGTADNFTVGETSTSTVTAENYYARGRYDRNVSEAVFLYGGAGWDRNTFAGIDNRYAFVTGVGRTWADRDDLKFRTDAGATYTIQHDVAPNPDISDSFAGARLSYDLFKRLSATTGFNSSLIVDENLADTDDLRADFTNSLSVAMSESLALKASLQLLIDNAPALTSIPLGTTGTNVLTPLGKTDSIFTLAIVMNF